MKFFYKNSCFCLYHEKMEICINIMKIVLIFVLKALRIHNEQI